MALSLVTAPAEEPVSLTEAQDQCKVDAQDDAVLIQSYVVAARRKAEQFTRRAFITQTYDLKLDGFWGTIELPRAPLQSLTSITYTDTDGVAQTWASSNYIVDAPAGPEAEPGRIGLAYGQTYPSTRNILNAVTIRFVAGYGDADDVPEDIKQAIRMLVGHLYANRESVVITARGAVVAEMPQAFEWMLWPYRVLRFG